MTVESDIAKLEAEIKDITKKIIILLDAHETSLLGGIGSLATTLGLALGRANRPLDEALIGLIRDGIKLVKK